MTCLIFYIFIRYKKPFYVSYNKEYTVEKNRTVWSIYEQKCQITAKHTTKVRKIIIVSKHLQKYLSFIPDYSEALIVICSIKMYPINFVLPNINIDLI